MRLLEDNKIVLATIGMLKSKVVGLAIHDFGTGFAGLTRLRKFPFDILKINMSFIKSMEKEERCQRILASTISLGQRLGTMIVAEGVGTDQ